MKIDQNLASKLIISGILYMLSGMIAMAIFSGKIPQVYIAAAIALAGFILFFIGIVHHWHYLGHTKRRRN